MSNHFSKNGKQDLENGSFFESWHHTIGIFFIVEDKGPTTSYFEQMFFEQCISDICIKTLAGGEKNMNSTSKKAYTPTENG